MLEAIQIRLQAESNSIPLLMKFKCLTMHTFIYLFIYLFVCSSIHPSIHAFLPSFFPSFIYFILPGKEYSSQWKSAESSNNSFNPETNHPRHDYQGELREITHVYHDKVYGRLRTVQTGQDYSQLIKENQIDIVIKVIA